MTTLLLRSCKRISFVVRDGYTGQVMNRYRLSLQGSDNALKHGVTPREIWELLEADGRLFIPVGERSRFVVGQTLAGRWIGFLAQESDTDDVWDIVAARPLHEQEIKQARQVRGDHDA